MSDHSETGKSLHPGLGPLEEFVRLFNQGHYWASHEVLEEAWRMNRSEFYRGLILLASAWVHRERGNRAGWQAQVRKAGENLRIYPARYLGMRMEPVWLLLHEDRYDHSGEVRLEWDPGLITGNEPEVRGTG